MIQVQIHQHVLVKTNQQQQQQSTDASPGEKESPDNKVASPTKAVIEKETPAKPEAKKGDETEKDKGTSEQQQRTDQQQLQQSLQQQQQLTDAVPGKKENQTKAKAGEKESSDNKVASPSKAVIESPDDKKAKALMSLAAGKRHMLVRDIPAAVSSLGKACKLLSAECGETSPECAEAYFHYGRALLEMDRLEAGVLDNC